MVALRRARSAVGRGIWGCVAAALLVVPHAAWAAGESIVDLEAAFHTPPPAARPWVFWYWMHGRVAPEAITADLEAMRRAGIAGAYLMPILGPAPSSEGGPADAGRDEFAPLAVQLSPQFWAMVRHAASEAGRLGLELGMHACDGFATAGGPWNTPEHSMQRVVWSEITVKGGRCVACDLPHPEAFDGFYRDIATLAFPTPEGWKLDRKARVPRVTVSVGGGGVGLERLASAGNLERFRSDEPCHIEYAFDAPFTARSVTITPDGANYQCQRFTVEAFDGAAWRIVAKLDAPRHGWQDEGAPVTHSLPATTASRFRFAWTPQGSGPGEEDLDNAKWAPVLKVNSIVLSSRATIHQFRGKTGAVWRRSPRTTDAQAPGAACVASSSVVDLTDRVSADGHLRWEAPAGDWVVLRFGHTSTGRRNSTGGGGVGLECDKMNATATRRQFEGWFGEAMRQIDDELTPSRRAAVLTTFHVDSWECGGQNWTADLPEQYARRAGGDPNALRPWLPTLAGVPVDSAEASERFLARFRRLLADLVVERFYGELRRLCDARGLRFTGECTAPTMPGDGMRHFAVLDAPMGEFWLGSPTHDKPNDMLDAVSAAHVYGKQLVQAEAFTQLRIGWDETPERLKSLGDLQFALGANRMVVHVWTHNPWLDRKPGQTLGGVGLYFQRDQLWAPMARGWTDYLSRCQTMLQAGSPVADVGVVVDEELPRRAMTVERIVDVLPGLVGVDAVAREWGRRRNHGQPTREAPVGVRASANIPSPADWPDPLRGYRFDSLPPDVFRASRRSGLGAVLDSGRSYALVVRSTERTAWTPEELAALGVPPDFLSYEPDGARSEQIAWNHRSADEWDVYFVSNQRAERREVSLSLRATRAVAEIWDPLTGRRRAAVARVGERTGLGLPLDPHGSAFVVLRDRGAAPAAGPIVEALRSRGPWSLSFEPAVGPTPPPRSLATLGDLTQFPELRSFAGLVRYRSVFELSDSPGRSGWWIELGDATGPARVTLNGVDCGVAWTAPWRVEVTPAILRGRNELGIELAGVWKNALIADAHRKESDRVTWTSAPVRLADESSVPLGVLGPVRLLQEDFQ